MSIRPLQYSEVERARIQQQIKALQEAVGGGGGGGPTAWGSITGTLSAQADLQTALDGKANSSHTHIIADVTGLQTALDGKQATLVSGTSLRTVNGNSLLGSGDVVISGGGLSGTATVTVPAFSLSHTETVAATGVTPSSIITPTLAPHLDTDENDAEFLSIVALSALAGTNQITFTLAFAVPTAGPIKLNWRA